MYQTSLKNVLLLRMFLLYLEAFEGNTTFKIYEFLRKKKSRERSCELLVSRDPGLFLIDGYYLEFVRFRRYLNEVLFKTLRKRMKVCIYTSIMYKNLSKREHRNTELYHYCSLFFLDCMYGVLSNHFVFSSQQKVDRKSKGNGTAGVLNAAFSNFERLTHERDIGASDNDKEMLTREDNRNIVDVDSYTQEQQTDNSTIDTYREHISEGRNPIGESL